MLAEDDNIDIDDVDVDDDFDPAALPSLAASSPEDGGGSGAMKEEGEDEVSLVPLPFREDGDREELDADDEDDEDVEDEGGPNKASAPNFLRSLCSPEDEDEDEDFAVDETDDGAGTFSRGLDVL